METDMISGYGSGYGDGSGDGSGYGSGYGYGYGSGSGYGDGSGSGYGYGYGDGSGSGDGYGYGYGYGDVIEIDNYQITLIKPFAVITIGCQCRTLDDWQANRRTIAEENQINITDQLAQEIIDAVHAAMGETQ